MHPMKEGTLTNILARCKKKISVHVYTSLGSMVMAQCIIITHSICPIVGHDRPFHGMRLNYSR